MPIINPTVSQLAQYNHLVRVIHQGEVHKKIRAGEHAERRAATADRRSNPSEHGNKFNRLTGCDDRSGRDRRYKAGVGSHLGPHKR